jgi:hypothetical protein
MIFMNSIRVSKTQHFTVPKINWLIMFGEIIPVYTKNHREPTNKEVTVTDCQSWWYVQFPLRFEELTGSKVNCTEANNDI